MLNVHLIPHTHDDVGWLKTVDQYYYGSKNMIQRAGVQYILDSVIQALATDARRRFTYVEMAFFMRWWQNQSLETQELVRQLVHSGRLQFALAGWSMADEATVHYTDAIDQLTRGHDSLRRLFGECGIPRVAWQIDPFGHSRDHSELFRDAGLDAVFFQRMDFREKELRKERRSLEVLWDTSVQPNSSSLGLFTSMFYDSYCYPSTFCFDDKCMDEPMRDDPTMEGYNIPERVGQFLHYVKTVRRSYATNHVMVLMGCDFTYENANINFKNTDKLIRYVNNEQSRGSDVNLLYSTPQCYTKAVNQAFVKKREIERRRGDFFPYASGPNSYWTGYFTSRPGLKRFVRDASNLLTMTEQVSAYG
ncbi:putative Lysosomal alpha-mannosidase [Fasciolopsis buskii]|uniref:Putative Lysosomal alpha-mannosidase n=1 Tax=Fasciolopsis buskii TaxID=27845 RepID=A0A8E0VE28_9TREM|nr:putative Lysosomal alpha-mannosidase [Fasciolopsis buski]